MADPQESRWHAQLLRLSLFTRAAVPGSETLWRTLTGSDPDTDENRPRELTRRQTGKTGDAALEVQVNAARTDVLMSAILSDGITPSLNFTFGSLESRVAAFGNMISPWLAGLQADVFRIAFGAIALFPADDRVKAYETLARHIPSLKVDPEKTRELLYRINRPKIGMSGMELNRIMTWNSIVFRTAIVASQNEAQLPESHYARLEIDNSTPANRAEPLDRASFVAIFNELVAMALENAADGELPR